LAQRAKILVLESAEGLRNFVCEALASEGYAVSTAREAEAALQMLREERIDVLIVDIFLPGIHGIEVLKRARVESQATVVILVGSGAPVQTVVNAMKAGAFDYLEKPLDFERLRLAVEKALMHARLERENVALRRVSDARNYVPELVSTSPAMQEVLRTVELVAPTDLTVLIEGESGVGKELVATRIHRRSPRAGMPFIAINCGILQENLLESELFGHEKGAFTGAHADHAGLFEIADRGTLFLDEIGELSQELQVKLLRVLETGEFRRLGGHKLIHVDARILCATNKRLLDEVKKGAFREDLYYRLNVIHVEVPPLRRRKEEIPALVRAFVERSRRRGLREKSFTKEALDVLMAYDWPGNVRELENLVERTLILAPGDEIRPEDLPRAVFEPRLSALPGGEPLAREPEGGAEATLAEIEKRHILRILELNGGNKVRTAKKLGINVKTLYNKLKRYRIEDENRPVSVRQAAPEGEG
jgi:DNA-binding NtrC family response regulator